MARKRPPGARRRGPPGGAVRSRDDLQARMREAVPVAVVVDGHALTVGRLVHDWLRTAVVPVYGGFGEPDTERSYADASVMVIGDEDGEYIAVHGGDVWLHEAARRWLEESEALVPYRDHVVVVEVEGEA